MNNKEMLLKYKYVVKKSAISVSPLYLSGEYIVLDRNTGSYIWDVSPIKLCLSLTSSAS